VISLLAKGLVIAGALILVMGLFTVRRLIGRLPAGFWRKRWLALTILIVLFVVGYAGYIGVFWDAHSNLFDLIVPGIFFFGACFVWLTVALSLQTALELMRISVLERDTFTDSLTGTFNRRYLDRRLKEEVASARRYGLPLAVLMLDIDHFKNINDSYGHPIGDQVLVSVAEICAEELRDSDMLARYGGEEFIVIAPHTPVSFAADIAERLRARIESHRFNPRSEKAEIPEITVTVSIGVTNYDDDTASAEDLLQAVDRNLYRAKEKGRNRVVADRGH